MAVCTDINRLTSSSFLLSIPLLPGQSSLAGTNELKLNIFGTVIPSMSLEAIEGRWQSNKMLFQSGGITFDPWEISFVVDSQLRNWRVLFDWMTLINNNMDIAGAIPNNYMVDCSLKISDNYNTVMVALMFKNVWVQSIGQIALSQREGELLLESTAVLYYDRIMVD
jgi:hypothetical protein